MTALVTFVLSQFSSLFLIMIHEVIFKNVNRRWFWISYFILTIVFFAVMFSYVNSKIGG